MPSDLQSTIDSADIPVVVKFGAAYCAPCRRLEPVLAELAASYRDRVRVVTVDIGAEPALADRYRVRSVPTLVAVVGGRVVAQQVGFSSRRKVEALFADLVGPQAPAAGGVDEGRGGASPGSRPGPRRTPSQ